jgi:hypothetical protein
MTIEHVLRVGTPLKPAADPIPTKFDEGLVTGVSTIKVEITTNLP